MKRIPSADRIEDFCCTDRPTALLIRRVLDGRADPLKVAPKTALWVNACFNQPRDIEIKLAACDELLDTCGTEAIRAEEPWDRFWGDTVAVYCNTGDSYGGTILYDVERGVFYVTSWADWVETAERNRRFTIR